MPDRSDCEIYAENLIDKTIGILMDIL